MTRERLKQGLTRIFFIRIEYLHQQKKKIFSLVFDQTVTEVD